MGPRIELRPARPDDGPFLFTVFASTREDELRRLGWAPEQVLAFLSQQFAAQSAHYRTHYPDARLDLIQVDGSPSGRLMVQRSPTRFHVVDISLLPGARGRGVGGTLLAELLVEARAARVPVGIEVECHNPAQRLYARLGFKKVNEQGLYRELEWTP